MTWYHYCITAYIEINADSRDEADKIADTIKMEIIMDRNLEGVVTEGIVYDTDSYCVNWGPEKIKPN